MSAVEIDGRRLAVTNLDKVLWPETGTTKGELLQYCVRVAPTLLAHLQGRPVTLRPSQMAWTVSAGTRTSARVSQSG